MDAHLEGWLAVAGLGDWQNLALRLMIAGRYDYVFDPVIGGNGPAGQMFLVLNGVMIKTT